MLVRRVRKENRMNIRLGTFWTIVVILTLPMQSGAAIVDRVAAIVEAEVITLSEVNALVDLHFIPRNSGESADAYRRRVLDAMIAQSLRLRDVERFGAEDVPRDSIEASLRQMVARASGQAEFDAILTRHELTLDELRTLIKRQIQVEAYIDERFSPLIFVSLEEIETYYNQTWSAQRRQRGLPVLPLGEVREEIRDLLKAERLQEEIRRWTEQLFARANVDVYVFR